MSLWRYRAEEKEREGRTYGADLFEEKVDHAGRMELEEDGIEDHAEGVVEVALVEKVGIYIDREG
jgi:hypothetical protein